MGMQVDEDKESTETRLMLKGFLILVAVAGLFLLVAVLLGHGIAGD
jgi:hypothetical protein